MKDSFGVLIYCIICIIVCLYTIYYMNKYFIKIKLHEINKKNQITFIRLKKQYLSKVNDDEIEDLIIFLYSYLIERKSDRNE